MKSLYQKRAARIIIFVFSVFLVVPLSFARNVPQENSIDSDPMWLPMALAPNDRILIMAPHPDDEIIGCAGIIQRAKAMHIPVHVVFLTYGDNNEWSFLVYEKHLVFLPKAVQRMGKVRHDEAIAAESVLGIPPSDITFLGYPDFRTMEIWNAHWANQPPVRSMLTRVTAVPYADALSPGAPYKGEEILKDIKQVLRSFHPTKIFLSHPGDHNGDHRSLYLFTRVALWDLEDEMKPEVFPYLVHAHRWPMPRKYSPTFLLKPPDLFRKQFSWYVYFLSEEEISMKYLALQKHRSQFRSTPGYLKAFVRDNELFGDFPEIQLDAEEQKRSLSASQREDAAGMPENLTDQERAAFVGIEERFAYRDADDIVLVIRFSRPLAEAARASVYLFGYRHDKLFTDMPKIHIRFRPAHHDVFDQEKELLKDNVKVTRKPKEITIRVPLKLLGNPQKILTSARTYISEIPLDWVSWRILRVTDLESVVPPDTEVKETENDRRIEKGAPALM